MSFVKAPVLPEFIPPPTFDPTIDCPISFIREYDKITSKNGWNYAFKIKYLECYLENAAFYWYKEYVNDKNNFNKVWSDIKKDFILEFGSEISLRKLKSKFRTRKQGKNEDIKSYYYDLLSIAHEIYGKINFEIFKDQFEYGLHESYDYHYYLLLTENMNFQSLKNIIYKISDLKDILLESKTSAYSRNSYHSQNSNINKRQSQQVNSNISQRRDDFQYEYFTNHLDSNLKGRTSFINNNNNYGSDRINNAGQSKYSNFSQSTRSSNNICCDNQDTLPYEMYSNQEENILMMSKEDIFKKEDDFVNDYKEETLDFLTLENAQAEEDDNTLPVAVKYAQAEEDYNTLPVAGEYLQVEDGDNTLPSKIECTKIENIQNELLEVECNSSSLPILSRDKAKNRFISSDNIPGRRRKRQFPEPQSIIESENINEELPFTRKRKVLEYKPETDNTMPWKEHTSRRRHRTKIISRKRNVMMAKDIIIHPSHPPWNCCR